MHERLYYDYFTDPVDLKYNMQKKLDTYGDRIKIISIIKNVNQSYEVWYTIHNK